MARLLPTMNATSLLNSSQEEAAIIKHITFLVKSNLLESALHQTKSLLLSAHPPTHLYRSLSSSSPSLSSSFSSLLITASLHLSSPNSALAVFTLIFKCRHPLPSPFPLSPLLTSTPHSLLQFVHHPSFLVAPDPFSFTLAVESLASSGDLKRAVSLLRHLQRRHGFTPGKRLYALLIHKSWRSLRGKLARKLFDEMLQRGITPNSTTLNCMIVGHCTDGDLTAALLLKDRMLAAGDRPSLAAYNAVVKRLCKMKKMIEARELVREMASHGVAPYLRTFNILALGYSTELLMFDECFDFLEEMRERFGAEPNARTYSLLACAVCNKGGVAEAEKIFLEMLGRGFSPKVVAFDKLVDAYVDEGRWRLRRHACMLADVVKRGLFRYCDR